MRLLRLLLVPSQCLMRRAWLKFGRTDGREERGEDKVCELSGDMRVGVETKVCKEPMENLGILDLSSSEVGESRGGEGGVDGDTLVEDLDRNPETIGEKADFSLCRS